LSVPSGANGSCLHRTRHANRSPTSGSARLAASGLRRAPYPQHLVEAIHLDDGSSGTIRPICRRDLLRERSFVAALSPQTLYQRFMSARRLQPGDLRRLTDIDYERELALVAIATSDGSEQIRGVARYVRDEREPDHAEFAIVVGDRWQARGLGERLLGRLVQAASAGNIAVLTGITLSNNRRMVALARKLGFEAWRQEGDATVTELRLRVTATNSGT
jgi:acetyltransferase